MMHLKEIRKIYKAELSSAYPPEEIDSFFYLAIEHYLNLERFILALQPEIILTKDEEEPLFHCLARLRQNEPIQYILGETFFHGLRIKVDRSVLIPRPETEELVHWILGDYQDDGAVKKILDIGTGSGCIAIALATEFKTNQIYAMDVSPEAIALAKQNAEYHSTKVEFVESDITHVQPMETKFDIIVSNPPYVRQSEKDSMKSHVADFEPHLALFVDDEDPLYYYRYILSFAKRQLVNGGRIYLEINQFLSDELLKLLEDEKFLEIELRKDIYGNDRMIRATWTG